MEASGDGGRMNMRYLGIVAVSMVAVMLGSAIANAETLVYNQGFETNTDGIIDYGGTVTRVASGSGTLGVTSVSGGYHAEVTLAGVYGNGFYTRNGGYSIVWPGYVRQSILLYIDPAAGAVDDGYFWDPGLTKLDGTPSGTWGRGGGFGVKKTAGDTWSLGAEDDYGGFDWFNNTGFIHTNTTALTITAAGWYKLQTEWLESTDGLWIDQRNKVFNSGGTELWTDMVYGVLATTDNVTQSDIWAGGVRYSWLGSVDGNTMGVLAFDDVQAAVPEPVTMAGVMLGIGSVVTYVRKRRTA